MNLVDLFRPKWRHSDRNVRFAAVRDYLIAPDDLVKIAIRDTDKDIRVAAAGRLTHDVELLQVIAKASDPDVRGTAVEKIMSQKSLARIAREDASSQVRAIARERITDQRLLDDLQAGAS